MYIYNKVIKNSSLHCKLINFLNPFGKPKKCVFLHSHACVHAFKCECGSHLAICYCFFESPVQLHMHM